MNNTNEQEHKQAEKAIFNLRDIMPKIEMPSFDLGFDLGDEE